MNEAGRGVGKGNTTQLLSNFRLLWTIRTLISDSVAK